jgi:hypothetical protein
MGAVCVPLYDSLGDASAGAYILAHSGAEVVFVQVCCRVIFITLPLGCGQQPGNLKWDL